MTWRVFQEPPGARDGDDALLSLMGERTPPPPPRRADRGGVLAWEEGRVLRDDPFIWGTLVWAWETAADAPSDVPDAMQRLADLAVKQAAAAT